MKKLSKLFGLLSAALLLGAIIGCEQGSSVITVETPALTVYEPVKTKYGVQFTWKPVYDNVVESRVTITRQEQDGEEIFIDRAYPSTGKWADKFGFGNILEDGKEYTYRFYNCQENAGVVATDVASLRAAYQGKSSVVEKKVKYDSKAESPDVIAEQGTKLDKLTDNEIEVYQNKNDIYINVLNKNEIATIKYVVKDAVGDEVRTQSNGSFYNLSTGKYTVEITRTWDKDYYAASDPLVKTFTVDANADNISVWGFSAVQRDADVILKWFSDDPAETPDFKIERKIESNNGYNYKWEVLYVEVTSGTMYNGDKYYTATDSTAKYGYTYTYRIKPSDKTSYSDSNQTNVTMDWKIKNFNADTEAAKNVVTLKWTIPVNEGEEPKFESLAIYRADGVLVESPNFGSEVISSTGYDLFEKLDITPQKLPTTFNDEVITYEAVDTDVVVNKTYTYIIVIDNKIASSPALVQAGAKGAYDVYFIDTDGSYADETYTEGNTSTSYTINKNNVKKDIKLRWKGNASTTDYKLFYRTYDNNNRWGSEQSNFIDEFPLKATVTNDGNNCYNAVIKPEDLGIDAKTPVAFRSIRIVVKGMDGDVQIDEDFTCCIDIAPVLTTYTHLCYIDTYLNQNNGDVYVFIGGHNLDKAVLYYEVNNAITPVKKLSEIEPTPDNAPYYAAEYSIPVPAKDLEMGYTYNFIVNFPEEDNYGDDPNEMAKKQSVYKVTKDTTNALKAKITVEGMEIREIRSQSNALGNNINWDCTGPYDSFGSEYYRLTYQPTANGTVTVTAIDNGATKTKYDGNVMIYGSLADGSSTVWNRGEKADSIPVSITISN